MLNDTQRSVLGFVRGELGPLGEKSDPARMRVVALYACALHQDLARSGQVLRFDKRLLDSRKLDHGEPTPDTPAFYNHIAALRAFVDAVADLT